MSILTLSCTFAVALQVWTISLKTPAELLGDIFPGDCECEFLGVSTSMNNSFRGYMEVTEVEDDDDDDEDDDDEED